MKDTECPAKEFVLLFTKLSTSAIFWVENCDSACASYRDHSDNLKDRMERREGRMKKKQPVRVVKLL